jgi:hypothetical protein
MFFKIADSNEKCNPSRIRLLNLNAMAKAGTFFGLGNYKGPFISKEITTKWIELLAPSDVKLSKLVIESLSNFLPPPKYLQTDIKSESGVFIGECSLFVNTSYRSSLDGY